MLLLKKGEKVDLTKNNQRLKKIMVGLGWQVHENESIEIDLDASAFLLDNSGRCRGDEDVVFYGNPQSRQSAVVHSGDKCVGDIERIQIDLSQVPADIERISFTITIYEGEKCKQNFEQVTDVYIRVFNQDNNVEILRFELDKDFSLETAIIAGEIYRYKNEWKFAAIGSGYYGGLGALCRSFGLETEEAEEESVKEPVPPKVNLSKIDLLKRTVKIVLTKNNISNQKARVAVVIDASGSMSNLYSKGTVQRAFERVLAVATCLDDDGDMETWFFADKSMRAPVANEQNFEGYIKATYSGPKIFGGIGCGNNEPVVMNDVIKKFTKEDSASKRPVFVIFFSDGGIYKDKEIQKILIECSALPIFWQFVGIGNADYGILNKLDNLPGRVVDNAGFFSLDDLDKITDEDLYNRLLQEFPLWLKEAKSKHIL